MDQFTTIVHKSLDLLGYSEEMVQKRREAYTMHSEALSKFLNTSFGDLTSRITGSKVEGMSGPLESDIDIMVTDHSIQCTDMPVPATGDVAYVFELDRNGAPPGYAKLRLHSKNRLHPDIECSLISNCLYEAESGGVYLSSAFYMSELQSSVNAASAEDESYVSSISRRMQRSGPSLPRSGEVPVCRFPFKTDEVRSFPCECSQYLLRWVERPRKYEWPSQFLIQMIATLDSHVVPVGQKEACEEFSLWRICYTPAEIVLMQSLNETQWKLYALLRMLKDAVFGSEQDIITSYVLKNIVMWLAESIPGKMFQPHLLVDRLVQSVKVLRKCVEKAFLPNYMIHERNLFRGRLHGDIRRDFLRLLDEMLLEGPNMILRCEAIRQNMKLVCHYPSLAVQRLQARNNAEEVCMLSFVQPVDKQVEMLRSCSLANTEEEYSSTVVLPHLQKQLMEDPRFSKLLVDLRFQNDQHLQAMVAKLIGNESIRQRIVQMAVVDKTFFDVISKLFQEHSDVGRGILAEVCHMIKTGAFVDIQEKMGRIMETFELPSDLSEHNSMDLLKRVLSAEPAIFEMLISQVVQITSRKPEMLWSLVLLCTGIPAGFQDRLKEKIFQGQTITVDTDSMEYVRGLDSPLGQLLRRK